MATIPPAFLDEIRTRLDLSDVVGLRVKLQRKGREWTACCPFHNEKTPSFYVNNEKGFYHTMQKEIHFNIAQGRIYPYMIRHMI